MRLNSCCCCSYSMVCSQDNRNNLALSCLQPEFIVHVIVSLFNSHLTDAEIAELLVRWFCRTRHSMKFVGLSSSGSSAPLTFDGAWPKASMSGLYKITKTLGNYLRHPLNSHGHVWGPDVHCCQQIKCLYWSLCLHSSSPTFSACHVSSWFRLYPMPQHPLVLQCLCSGRCGLHANILILVMHAVWEEKCLKNDDV